MSSSFLKLLPKFVQKMTHGELKSFSWQKIRHTKDNQYGFFKQERKLTEGDWIAHFEKHPISNQFETVGSLGFPGLFRDSKIKWICFDFDNQELVDRGKAYLVPFLKDRNIEYIWEFGGDHNDRAHLWILTDECDIKVAEDFWKQTLHDLGITFPEIYPLFNKQHNLIRMPYGPHIRRDSYRFPVEYNGVVYDTLEGVLRAFIACVPVTQKYMLENTREEFISPEKPKYGHSGPFYYTPRRLDPPLPMEKIPLGLRKVVNNCQAINEVIRRVVQDGYLNDTSGIGHDAGLYLSNICMVNDAIDYQKKKEDGTRKVCNDGKRFLNMLIKKYRLNSPDSHNWDYNFSKVFENPVRYFPKCEKWENFGFCKGCPVRNEIGNPRRFMSAKILKPIPSKTIKLKTPDEIRRTTLADISARIDQLIASGEKENILIATPQQSGKSYWSSQTIARLYQEHPEMNFLLLVPNAKLAMEHKQRLKNVFGVPSYALMAYKNNMKHLWKRECPGVTDITHKIELGLGAGRIRDEVCQDCPFIDECSYPNQYANAMEPEHRVIILQHAHLSSQEIIYSLRNKNFGLLIVDEEFIDNCITFDKAKPEAIEILKGLSTVPWALSLAKWMEEGGRPRGRINAEEEELEEAKLNFDASKVNWDLPNFVRHFNLERWNNPYTGVEVINTLPEVPITVLTNATSGLELTQEVTGLKNIVVYGTGDVLDIKAIHPGNEIIQILDSPLSKTGLNKDELFYELLSKIGYLIKTRYKDKKNLITTFIGWEKKAIEYFEMNASAYPGILDMITFGSLERGTNAYSDFDTQWLLAGVYFNGNDYYLETYKYKTAANYHRRKANEKEYPNIYPDDCLDRSKMVSIEREKTPVTRIETSIPGYANIVEYEEFTISPPVDYWFNLIFEKNKGTNQQAMRLRFDADKPRHAYILGNMDMPSLPVTRSLTLSQFLFSY